MNLPLHIKYIPPAVYYTFVGGWLAVIAMSVLYPAYYLLIGCETECSTVGEIYSQFMAYPGIWGATVRSFLIGMAATILSFVLAVTIYIHIRQTGFFAYARMILMPVLAVPHSAFALGMVALFSEVGLAARFGKLISEHFFLPEWLLPYHHYGYPMVIALALRELPFIIFLLMANEDDDVFNKFVHVGYSLGYSAKETLLKLWMPYIYPKIRLGLLIILSFSVSVVDVGIILGPTAPPTLGLMILHFFKESDTAAINHIYPAGILLGVTVIMVFISWIIAEKIMAKIFKYYVTRGKRGSNYIASAVMMLPAILALIIYILMFPTLLLQMFAFRWRFPDILPQKWTLNHLMEHADSILTLTLNSIILALCATLVSMFVSIVLLEMLIRFSKRIDKELHVFYLTLIIPQILTITGLYHFTVRENLDDSYSVMVLFHMLFTLPYMLFSLSGSWLRFNRKYTDVAETFGNSALTILFRIKIPMLIRPIIYATAIGCSVSLSLYIPTVFSMRGRYPTLTTEAVALSSGSDLSITMIYAVFQMILAFTFFMAAYLIADIILKKRRLIIQV